MGDGLPQRLKIHREYAALIEELVRRRKRKKLTQKEVASVLGADQSLVSKYERFERELSLIDYVRYCEAIGADSQKLLQALRRPRAR